MTLSFSWQRHCLLTSTEKCCQAKQALSGFRQCLCLWPRLRTHTAALPCSHKASHRAQIWIEPALHERGSPPKAKSRSNTQDIDVLLGEFLHGKSTIKTVLCYVALLCVGLGILQAVAAHLGVCVVDGVDENEDHRGDHHGDSHEACNQGQVVHCCKRNKETKKQKKKKQLSITIHGDGVHYDVIIQK